MQRKNKVLQYGLDRWYIGVNKSISVWTHHTRLERLVSTMKKHLTLDDRISIQEGLDQGLSLGKIAKSLDKATSTISREVNAHRVKAGRISERVKVPCSFRDTCKEEHLCKDVRCDGICRNCMVCMDVCRKYAPGKCPELEVSPHVCNACEKTARCRFDRWNYIATYAQDEYEKTLIEAREGINQEPEKIQEIDDLVSPLLKKGQPLSHIYATHAEEIGCSRSSMYNYIHQNVFSARDIDLPRKVRYRPRKKHTDHTPTEEERAAVKSRDYQCFLQYMAEHPDAQVVEMDTVVGPIHSKKAVLTMLFRSCSLMIMLLLERKTQENVIAALNWLSDELGITLFQKTFPVILADRGTEFLFPEAMECDSNGELKTKVFYCDPQNSNQKSMLERNHEYIRMVVPKKVATFDHLTQVDITLLANNINSVTREKLNGNTPYTVSRLFLDHHLHEVLGYKEIPPDDVCLKPELLGCRGMLSYWKNR